MSPTMVVSAAAASTSTSNSTSNSTSTRTTTTTTTLLPDRPSCCPNCSFAIPPLENGTQLLEAQALIAELETQVCLLNQKATAAVDRWAEYEAELSKLRAQLSSSSSSTPASPSSRPDPTTSMMQSPTRASFFQTGASRLSSLVYPRRSQAQAAAAAATAANAPSQTAEDLLEALTREKTLRRAAECRLSATSKEVEELSAALFEQANEMVADERRARAKLEQRVDELEKRDADKKRRLDRLELAMVRIERVRNLLQETQETVAPPAFAATVAAAADATAATAPPQNVL